MMQIFFFSISAVAAVHGAIS